MAVNRSIETVDRSYFLWRGGLGVLLGILVLVWPKLTVVSLVTLVSIWLLIVGVVNIVQGVSGVRRGGWTWIVQILLGFLELGVGAYLVQRPGVTTLTIVTLVGAVFVVQGLIHLFNTFFEAGSSAGNRVLSLLFALLSLVAGIWLMRYPLEGTLAFVWLLGLYAIASGALLIALGLGAGDDK